MTVNRLVQSTSIFSNTTVKPSKVARCKISGFPDCACPSQMLSAVIGSSLNGEKYFYSTIGLYGVKIQGTTIFP